MKQGNLRPKARILRTLGAELISSDKVALVELVKGSVIGCKQFFV